MGLKRRAEASAPPGRTGTTFEGSTVIRSGSPWKNPAGGGQVSLRRKELVFPAPPALTGPEEANAHQQAEIAIAINVQVTVDVSGCELFLFENSLLIVSTTSFTLAL